MRKEVKAFFMSKSPESVAPGMLIDVFKNHVKQNKEDISTKRMGFGFRQT